MPAGDHGATYALRQEHALTHHGMPLYRQRQLSAFIPAFSRHHGLVMNRFVFCSAPLQVGHGPVITGYCRCTGCSLSLSAVPQPGAPGYLRIPSPEKHMSAPLLSVEGLSTYFYAETSVSKAVCDVSYTIAPGETLGVVGESGCGKSVTALSVLRLIPEPPGRIIAGKIMFNGTDLLRLSEKQMRAVRGNSISMIFQEPMTSLNPVFRVGEQLWNPCCCITTLAGNLPEPKPLNCCIRWAFPHPHHGPKTTLTK